MKKSVRKLTSLVLAINLMIMCITMNVMAEESVVTVATDGASVVFEHDDVTLTRTTTGETAFNNTYVTHSTVSEGSPSEGSYGWISFGKAGTHTATSTATVKISQSGYYNVSFVGYVNGQSPSYAIKAGGESKTPATDNAVVFKTDTTTTGASSKFNAKTYTASFYLEAGEHDISAVMTATGGGYRVVFDTLSIAFDMTQVKTDGTSVVFEHDDVTLTRATTGETAFDNTYVTHSTVSEGSPSEGSYGWISFGKAGTHTATSTATVKISQSGYYNVSFVGYVNGESPSYAIKVGEETQTPVTDSTVVFKTDTTTTGTSSKFNAKTYTASFYLEAGEHDISAVMTATGGGYRVVFDTLSIAFDMTQVKTDGTSVVFEHDDVTLTRATTGETAFDNTYVTHSTVSEGSPSEGSYGWISFAKAGTHTATSTATVKISQSGYYNVSFVGYVNGQSPSYAIKVGEESKTPATDNAVVFKTDTTTTGTSSKFNAKTYTASFYLEAGEHDISAVMTATGGGYKVVFDTLSIAFDMTQVKTDGTALVFEHDDVTLTGATTGETTFDKTYVTHSTVSEGSPSEGSYGWISFATTGTHTATSTATVKISQSGYYNVSFVGYVNGQSPSYAIKVGEETQTPVTDNAVVFKTDTTTTGTSSKFNAKTYTASFYLEAGEHDISAVMTATGGGYKVVFDTLSIAFDKNALEYNVSETVGNDTIMEIDNADEGVIVSSDAGSAGSVLGVKENNIIYTIELNVTTGGDYMIELCGTEDAVSVKIDEDETVILGAAGTLKISDGSYFAEDSYPYNTYVLANAVSLTAGNHTMQLFVNGDEAGAAIDYVKFTLMEEPEEITLSDIDDMNVGSTANVTVDGIDVEDMYQVTYSSSADSVVSVDGNGLITANGAGTATITAVVKKYVISEGVSVSTTVTVISTDAVTIDNAYISNGQFSATITKNMTLDKTSKAYLAIFKSADDMRMMEVKVIDMDQNTGTTSVSSEGMTTTLASGNVVKLFVWTTDDLTPWCNCISLTVE